MNNEECLTGQNPGIDFSFLFLENQTTGISLGQEVAWFTVGDTITEVSSVALMEIK